MDFIKRKAQDFTVLHYQGGVASDKELIDEARAIVSDLDQHLDKIKFLNLVLERNNLEYVEHLKVCKNKEDCDYNYSYESVAYYLTQELNRLGVKFDNDTFTTEEKSKAESSIEQILKDLNEVKMGQQVLFDELEEMRQLFFLGKRKWYQLFIGKGFEMVASGVVSETISKKILEAAKKDLHALIGL